jgi:hypothetical protein
MAGAVGETREEGLVGQATSELQEAASTAQEKAVELAEHGKSRLEESLDLRTNQAGQQARQMAQALRQGGTELNPLMGGVAGSPEGLIAVKLATTFTTIAATELLWRSHPKAAVIAMAIITSGYGLVVTHNYRGLR